MHDTEAMIPHHAGRTPTTSPTAAAIDLLVDLGVFFV
jgi:hypothetical protein